jgi:hypothetical protein
MEKGEQGGFKELEVSMKLKNRLRSIQGEKKNINTLKIIVKIVGLDVIV